MPQQRDYSMLQLVWSCQYSYIVLAVRIAESFYLIPSSHATPAKKPSRVCRLGRSHKGHFRENNSLVQIGEGLPKQGMVCGVASPGSESGKVNYDLCMGLGQINISNEICTWKQQSTKNMALNQCSHRVTAHRCSTGSSILPQLPTMLRQNVRRSLNNFQHEYCKNYGSCVPW